MLTNDEIQFLMNCVDSHLRQHGSQGGLALAQQCIAMAARLQAMQEEKDDKEGTNVSHG